MHFNLLNVDARIEQNFWLIVIRSYLYNNVSTMDKLIVENTSNITKTTKVKRKESNQMTKLYILLD